MKSLTFILAIGLVAGAAAQTVPIRPPLARPALSNPASAMSKPSAAGGPGREGVHGTPNSPRVRRTHVSEAIVGRPVITRKGERDPFVSPVHEHPRVVHVCSGTGRQCLGVSEIVLRGVVRSEGRLIAVVANGPHTYFLHERDPLADGEVVRITPDSIVLRLRARDAAGRSVSHEVTRKLGAPS